MASDDNWIVAASDQDAADDMHKHGLVAFVKVASNAGEASRYVVAVIDTGADTTCIDKRLADTLGMQATRFDKRSVVGRGDVPIAISSGALGFKDGVTIELPEVGIADLNDQCAVLIGRDILSKGRLIADFKSGNWILHLDRNLVRVLE